ncbi:MAG: GH92 family glycosyl hydrolase, partial [Bacteroidales bacterium]|nr:GH92 family glycosyl hydrolase [Bacteroidales bacterium]
FYPGEGGYNSRFSHEQEEASPGYYRVKLLRYGIDVELTATRRGAVHRITFPEDSTCNLLVDLVHGPYPGGCTIHPDEQYDTVTASVLEILDDSHIRGYKVSAGWGKDQHVYFYAGFSRPILSSIIWQEDEIAADYRAEGPKIKACLSFSNEKDPLQAKVAISTVSMEGAEANFLAELGSKDFNDVREEARNTWNRQLKKIRVENGIAEDQESIFYTAMYHSMQCLYLNTDVDGKYRGADRQIHQAEGFENILGYAGFWDIYRAALPLQIILNPDVNSNLVNSLLVFYEQHGLLPVFPVAQTESMTMLGYHSMPVIADAYAKGIRGYDEKAVYEAMKYSAMKDSFGVWMKEWQGIWNYKEIGYVPCDREYSSVSKTLEYAYDDWCVARMAGMLQQEDDQAYFLKRSMNYRNVFDSISRYMRPRNYDGSWLQPFNPWEAGHHRGHYAEGTAWQWTFFVQHDIPGLISLFGGREPFVAKLDSLFEVSSELMGDVYTADISGLIGQYAHGNEPSHHIIYLYNYAGQPWKTQERIRQVITTQYHNDPDGISGDEDTGQMSAWYVFSALGFYPVCPGSTEYAIGAPQFEKSELQLPTGKTLRITCRNHNVQNKYIQSLVLNGQEHRTPFVSHDQLMEGGEWVFTMGSGPNLEWFN